MVILLMSHMSMYVIYAKCGWAYVFKSINESNMPKGDWIDTEIAKDYSNYDL